MSPIAKQSKLTPQYFNEFGKNITSAINAGTTLFFPERSKAAEHARKTRSYSFEVFDEKILIGFGVSK